MEDEANGGGGRSRRGPKVVTEQTTRTRTIGEAVAEQKNGAPDPESQAIDALLTQMPPGGQIKLYRREGMKESWLARVPVEGFSEEMLKETFGGGEYKLRVVKSDGSYVRQFSVVIAGKPKEEGEQQAPPPQFGAYAGMTPFLMQRLDAMEERQERLMERIAQLSQPVTPAKPFDVVGVIGAITPLVVPLLQGMMQREQVNPAETLAAAAELFRTGIEAGGQYANGAPPNVFTAAAPIVEKLSSVATAFADLKGRELALRAGQPVQQQIAAPAQPAAPPAPAHWADVFRPYVGFVRQLAAENKDPNLYAYLFLDRLGPEQADAISTLAVAGTLKQELYARIPAYAEMGPWMETFLDTVIESLTEEEDGAEVGGGLPAVVPLAEGEVADAAQANA